MSLSRPMVGLIGCGRWGRLWLRDLLEVGAQVIVVDPDPRALSLAREAGVPGVPDLSVLPRVDALVVATPAITHAFVLEGLLARRVPILVEKPFTIAVDDARRLARAAAGRVFVGHTWRYHPGIELLGTLARTGAIGRVLGVRSTRTNWTSPRTDVDTIWNLAPHDLTIAIEILGGIPEPSAALVERHRGSVVGMTALLGGEPWLAFDVSNRYPDKRREVRVHGTEGVAVMHDPDSGQVTIVRGDASSPTFIEEPRPYGPESALGRQLRAFLAFVAGGAPPKSPVEEGVAVVEAVARLRVLAGL